MSQSAHHTRAFYYAPAESLRAPLTNKLVACFLMFCRYDSPRVLLDDYDSGFSALVHKLGEENEGKLRETAGAKPPRSHVF
jgi:hypothetical protein